MAPAQLRLLVNPHPVPGGPSAPGTLPRRVLFPSPERALLAQGIIGADTLASAEGVARTSTISTEQVLLRRGAITPEALCNAQSATFGALPIDLASHPPDPRLIDRLGPALCLKLSILPIRLFGGMVLLATSRPDRLPEIRAALPGDFGEPLLTLCSEDALHSALQTARGAAMAAAAETRVPEEDSCRFWYNAWPRLAVGGGLAALVIAIVFAPALSLGLLTLLALLAMCATTLVRGLALLTQLRRIQPETPPALSGGALPVVSIMVPLLREENIALRLITRLERLSYPRELLDICLVTEASDAVTRNTLAATRLPRWMRVITVPDGSLKTKPRALNYALDFCRGTIIGIYDAEDAPDPDQILRVVQQFHASPPEVACLQGALDFYNTSQNWMSRCFTIDYAGWFRIVLPGISRLGLVVPLGGTTLFLRREVIEALGGWDAHNVTEDADLGIRLARRGYRTDLVDTVTQEEANCHLLPWVKQRSRWIKGYAMTWTVHMRRPRQLWRELGAWRFAGFQAMFLGSLLQAFLMPVIWSLWLHPLGLYHPLGWALSSPAIWGLTSMFALAEAANLASNAAALAHSGKRKLWFWLPVMHIYYPLATAAAYKALVEMLVMPFYWDKTRHGIAPPQHQNTV